MATAIAAESKAFSHPKYRPDIDGLRAVAVLSVVGFHAFPAWFEGGFIGVDVFFVISGFLISTILFQNLDKGTFSFSQFYGRRIKRIFPSLLLVLIAAYAVGWFALLADEYKQLGKHIAAGAGFISNLVLWREAGYFDNSAETKPLLHLWSLGIEEQFYIVWPFLLWIAWKTRFSLLVLTIVLGVVSFVLSIREASQDIVAAFYSPQTRFYELLCGSLLAWLLLYRKAWYENAKRRLGRWLARRTSKEGDTTTDENRTSSNLVSIVGASLLAFGFWRINESYTFPGAWALVPVGGAVLLILAGPEAWINRRILSSKLAVGIGLISFPFYLWHWVLLSFARIIECQTPSRSIRIAAVILSAGLSWLTYRLVERPLRFGGYSKTKITALAAAMALMGFVGYNTYEREGYGFRASIRNLKSNRDELVRTPRVDDACLKYIGVSEPLFPYCRFTDAKSRTTVAVIGDSHAHVAYTGIAEFLKERGINTVLLASSGCPPFEGIATGKNDAEREACRRRTHQLIDVAAKLDDVHKVFVFTRGPIYNTGTEPLTGNKERGYGVRIPVDEFAEAAQRSIQTLVDSGKSVYYVTENPELRYTAGSCIDRPFKTTLNDCAADRAKVLERQKAYLEEFAELRNVTYIRSVGAFCPEDRCVVFDDDGALLYADDDHLSVAGSRFQVRKLLREYLN